MPRDRWVTLNDKQDLFIRGHDFNVCLREIRQHRILDLSISSENAASVTPMALTKKLLLYPDARFRTVRMQAHGERDDSVPRVGTELVVLDDRNPDRVIQTVHLDIDELAR